MKRYSVKDYSIIFAGQAISGFAEEFFEVGFNGEGFTQTVGADGEVATNDDANESGTVTLNLLQTSASNEFFSTIFRTAKEGGQLHHDLLIRDANGKTEYVSADAVVKRIPDTSRGKEAGSNGWEILCGHLKGFEGGSN